MMLTHCDKCNAVAREVVIIEVNPSRGTLIASTTIELCVPCWNALLPLLPANAPVGHNRDECQPVKRLIDVQAQQRVGQRTPKGDC